MYNTILRRFPAAVYDAYRAGGYLFPTTITVLCSAVVKIARATRLPQGLELFRGLGGRLELPAGFSRADGSGCVGYTEYGFMSTTSNKETALEYSGAKAEGTKPMVHSPPIASPPSALSVFAAAPAPAPPPFGATHPTPAGKRIAARSAGAVRPPVLKPRSIAFDGARRAIAGRKIGVRTREAIEALRLLACHPDSIRVRMD